MYRQIDAWIVFNNGESIAGVNFRRKLIEEVEGTSVGSFGFVITVTDVRTVMKDA